MLSRRLCPTASLLRSPRLLLGRSGRSAHLLGCSVRPSLAAAAALAQPCRSYGSSNKITSGGHTRDPHYADDDFSLQHFDVQDVDPDRLSHFYWDRGEDSGSPFSFNLLTPTATLDEMDEGELGALEQIYMDDYSLLSDEYVPTF